MTLKMTFKNHTCEIVQLGGPTGRVTYRDLCDFPGSADIRLFLSKYSPEQCTIIPYGLIIFHDHTLETLFVLKYS